MNSIIDLLFFILFLIGTTWIYYAVRNLYIFNRLDLYCIISQIVNLVIVLFCTTIKYTADHINQTQYRYSHILLLTIWWVSIVSLNKFQWWKTPVKFLYKDLK
jgi:uncharacterized membrane protein